MYVCICYCSCWIVFRTLGQVGFLSRFEFENKISLSRSFSSIWGCQIKLIKWRSTIFLLLAEAVSVFFLTIMTILPSQSKESWRKFGPRLPNLTKSYSFKLVSIKRHGHIVIFFLENIGNVNDWVKWREWKENVETVRMIVVSLTNRVSESRERQDKWRPAGKNDNSSDSTPQPTPSCNP